VAEVQEPWLNLTLISPHKYLGQVMELVSGCGGEFKNMEYLSDGGSPWSRVLLKYEMPLRTMISGFYDDLKSRTQGYASLDYEVSRHRPAQLTKLDILVNYQVVDALSSLVPADEAYEQGKATVEKLRQLIPRQLFDVAIQAAVGGKVIARETIKAMRKNVLAKCYGGDVSRKRKLLEKQAEGKKRLKKIGQVEVPQEAFWAMMKKD
ncbi:MAG: elongation factor 4, partial [Chloroflexota bacterium]